MDRHPATRHLRRRTRLGAVALAAGLALLATGCGSGSGETSQGKDGAQSSGSQTPVDGGILRVGTQDPGSDLEPSEHASAGSPAGYVAEKLVLVDAKNTANPQLATSWKPAADGLSWRVEIRQGVKFNDGSDFGPDDVVATYRHLIDPKSTSPAKSALGAVKSVKADGTAVVFTLGSPFSSFPFLLGGSNTEILPANYQRGTWTKTFVGTGPFVVEQYNPGQGITLKRNENYWNRDKIHLAGIKVNYYKDQQAIVLAAQSGEIDGLWGEPVPSDLTQALDRGKFQLVTNADSGFHAFVLRVDVAPFDDVKVRQAVAWALDRKAIIDTVWAGEGEIGNDTVYSSAFQVQPKGLQQRTQDLAKVKELLGGKKVQFTITTLPTEQSFATLLQQQLNATGSFNVKTEILSEEKYYATGDNSPWLSAPATITYWATRPSPSQYIDYLYRTGSDWNGSHYSNKELDKLSTEYDATTDPAKQQELVDKIAAIQWDDVPVIVVANPQIQAFVANGVHLNMGSRTVIWADSWIGKR